jgi:hypothetical protein
MVSIWQEGSVVACAKRALVAAKRKPKPEIATSLAAVSDALEAVGSAEAELERARRRLRAALRAAHKLGASYSVLGRLTGLSRQRVAQLIGQR